MDCFDLFSDDIKEANVEPQKEQSDDLPQEEGSTKKKIHRVTIAVNESYYWKIKKLAIRKKTTVTKLFLEYVDSFYK